MWWARSFAIVFLAGLCLFPDEMVATSIPGLLAHVGFASPARPLDEAEAGVLANEVRRVLNGALAIIARDAAAPVDSGTMALANAVTNGVSTIRGYTPQLTSSEVFQLFVENRLKQERPQA